jgi:hypothetical protein
MATVFSMTLKNVNAAFIWTDRQVAEFTLLLWMRDQG